MIEARSGTIVNIASMSGVIVNRPQPQIGYNVSKAGVIMLTKSLAAEWAPYGIRVNAVAPGYIRSAITESLLGKGNMRDYWIGGTPAGEDGLPRGGRQCRRVPRLGRRQLRDGRDHGGGRGLNGLVK